jgi:predicted nucleic acid-binding protein
VALTVLDAGIVIAILSTRDAHHEAARRALGAVRRAGDELVLPASAYAETLVEPFEQDADSFREVDDFLLALPARVAPIDPQVARAAAKLRAHYRSLKLPDAMVVATAETLKAHLLMTTDRGWPRGLPMRVQAVGQRLVRRR